MPELLTSQGEPVYETIKKEIQAAIPRGLKTATFHYHVLVNTEKSQEADPKEFCRDVGMEESYATEFRKMRALAHLIDQRDVELKLRAMCPPPNQDATSESN